MKAILLIDKAESCTSCLLGIYNKKWFCLATNKDIDITDRYNIPKWCPLRPIPEKIEEGEEPNIKYGISEYAVGRNDVIDEILGETE